MKIIGLTGGIGSGKSTVSRYLQSRGYQVIDADGIARSIVEVGKPSWCALFDYFGKAYFYEDGSLNRKALGAFVFSNPEALQALNDRTHPYIRQIISEHIRAFQQTPVGKGLVLDAPLLYETGLDSFVDEVWYINCDVHLQIQRIIARDGLNLEEAQHRIDAQKKTKEMGQTATFVLNNKGSYEELISALEVHLHKEEMEASSGKDKT